MKTQTADVEAPRVEAPDDQKGALGFATSVAMAACSRAVLDWTRERVQNQPKRSRLRTLLFSIWTGSQRVFASDSEDPKEEEGPEGDRELSTPRTARAPSVPPSKMGAQGPNTWQHSIHFWVNFVISFPLVEVVRIWVPLQTFRI